MIAGTSSFDWEPSFSELFNWQCPRQAKSDIRLDLNGQEIGNTERSVRPEPQGPC
jgi:hypothetical protein